MSDNFKKIHIETYNCDEKFDKSGRFFAQMGYNQGFNFFFPHGLKQHVDKFQHKGIYLYQEIPTALATNLVRDGYKRDVGLDKYFGEESLLFYYEDPSNRNNFFEKHELSYGMVMTPQRSFRGKSGTPFPATVIRDEGDHEFVSTTSNMICWTPQFLLHDIIRPSYWEEDERLDDYRNRTGCRSTPIVILGDVETNIEYAVISVHGNSGPAHPKRIPLIRSVLADLQKYANLGYKTILGGDLNMQPEELFIALHTDFEVPEGITRRDFTPVLNAELERHEHILPKDFPTEFYAFRHTFKQFGYESLKDIDKFKITHYNENPPHSPADPFVGTLDWIIIDKDTSVGNYYVDNIDPRILPKSGVRNPSDHANVRVVINEVKGDRWIPVETPGVRTTPSFGKAVADNDLYTKDRRTLDPSKYDYYECSETYCTPTRETTAEHYYAKYQRGGDPYFAMYMKQKEKYINLKNRIFNKF
jgi:hypothetical protein